MSEIDAKGASGAEIDAQRGLESGADISALLWKSPKVGRIRGQGVRILMYDRFLERVPVKSPLGAPDSRPKEGF